MTKSLKTIHIVFAHPNAHESKTNKALLAAVRHQTNISVSDLYHRYPHSYINVRLEQEELAKASVIVLQHPMFWYSVPGLMKEWIDATLTAGWAFGKDGKALAGKRWAHALSTGGPAAQYAPDAAMSIDKLLLPLECTAKLCHTEWRAPFLVHDAERLSESDLQNESQRYLQWLEQLSID